MLGKQRVLGSAIAPRNVKDEDMGSAHSQLNSSILPAQLLPMLNSRKIHMHQQKIQHFLFACSEEQKVNYFFPGCFATMSFLASNQDL